MEVKAQTPIRLRILMVLVFLSYAGKTMQQIINVKENESTHSPVSNTKQENTTKTPFNFPLTTIKPLEEYENSYRTEFALDGRHAYINNEFVAEQKTLSDINTYDNVRPQVEKGVLTNTNLSQRPQQPEAIKQNANIPGKPLFSYNIKDYDDYNENNEELSEQEEQQVENCEDTEESLNDNGDGPTIYDNKENKPEIKFSQAQPTKKSNSNKQNKPVYQSNAASKSPYDSNNYSSLNDNAQSKESSNTQQYPVPQLPSHIYQPVLTILPTYSTLQYPSTNRKPANNKQPTQVINTKLQSPSSKPHILQATPKPYKYPTIPILQYNANPAIRDSTATNPQILANPKQQSNYDLKTYNNSESPFSTSLINGSVSTIKPARRRRLTFRTVSTSTQFVATPLADLMLKFSIGMADRSENGSDTNPQ